MQPFVEEKLIPERDSHEDVIQREKEFITAPNDDEEEEAEEEEDIDDDDEFSFVSVGGEIADTSLISADEAFANGQIKPTFPVFNEELLSEFERMTLPEDSSLPVKKIFVQTEEDRATSSSESDIVSGPYCDLSSRKLVEVSSSSSSERCNCKKSNSTGFSKIWRFNKDYVGRSNSDGRDAFVFLSESHAPRMKKTDRKGVAEKSTVKSVGVNKTASYSAHEAYLRSKVKEDKRKRSSYLPYRPELMGFFTNVNSGLTKNVHPF